MFINIWNYFRFGVWMDSLKEEFLRLLEKDTEFRYAVAGRLGILEVLRKLDTIAEEQTKIWKEIEKLREEQVRFREEQTRIWREIEKLREEQARFREEQTRIWREIERLRRDMVEGFSLVSRHISALGARWGLMSEEAFREGLKGILEKEFGVRVERWSCYDDLGLVYGYPSMVEVDIAVKDDKILLIEIASHIKTSDVYEFKRKAKLYEKKTRGRPDRLLMVTPYVEEKALEAAKRHGIEIYTKI